MNTEQKKEMIVNDTRTIIRRYNGYCTGEIVIAKGYYEEGQLVKTINLSLWDDICFTGWSNDKQAKRIDFDFEVDDPLYPCIEKMLSGEDVLAIDDDDTMQLMDRFMLVRKTNDRITISLLNKKDNVVLTQERFRVFIKNIKPDCRSKADRNSGNVKTRILDFFAETEKMYLRDREEIVLSKKAQ